MTIKKRKERGPDSRAAPSTPSSTFRPPPNKNFNSDVSGNFVLPSIILFIPFPISTSKGSPILLVASSTSRSAIYISLLVVITHKMVDNGGGRLMAGPIDFLPMSSSDCHPGIEMDFFSQHPPAAHVKEEELAIINCDVNVSCFLLLPNHFMLLICYLYLITRA